MKGIHVKLILSFTTALLLAPLAAVHAADPQPARVGNAAAEKPHPVPLIDVTDLYHPPQDRRR